MKLIKGKTETKHEEVFSTVFAEQEDPTVTKTTEITAHWYFAHTRVVLERQKIWLILKTVTYTNANMIRWFGYWLKSSQRSTWWLELSHFNLISQHPLVNLFCRPRPLTKTKCSSASYLRQTVLANLSDPWAKFNHLSLGLGPGLIKNVLVNL